MTEHSTSNRTGAQSVGNESAHFVRRFFIRGKHMERIKREPVRFGAALGSAIITLVSSVLVLAVAFGVQITDVQQAAIMGVVGAVIAIAGLFGVGEWVRRKVTPMASPRTESGEPAAIVPAAYWSQLVTRVQRAERHD